ncbi:hypothetical protein ES332_A04G074200v1 [Gossypium tomentosum]|uniref:apyrase n=1 Tax=Gossypium tomentosum TaxID=34277 RepID=A0A5D2QVY5_GOSTO|nr:hypothetical protein ES332_A04G074200v1 [Gossypium tomentosum]
MVPGEARLKTPGFCVFFLRVMANVAVDKDQQWLMNFRLRYHFTCVLWTIFFNFMEVFVQVLVSFMWVVLLQLKPGLSYYAKDPQAAANSLTSLLDKAESVVLLDLRSKTAVRVGVRELLKSRSTLKSEANGVQILDGSQEGSYEAPSLPAGQDNYVNEMYLKRSKYYLYVHSYLHYGLLAARAEILKATEDSGNPCILEGFDARWIIVVPNFQPNDLFHYSCTINYFECGFERFESNTEP